MIFEFNGYKPIIHESAFIHQQANVTGNVIIGENVYVGPGAVIRGDWGEIIIEDGCNVQENCTIHMFPGTSVILKKGAHIGHGAIIHGGVIGENVLVGMNAVVMDDCLIGANCIIGALSFVPAKTIISDSKGTALYQKLPFDCKETLKECEPLREVPSDRLKQKQVFKTWDNTK